MESFCFKEFKVRQGQSAMKVNTDGVLLGAWVSLPKVPSSLSLSRVLDVGTGTGVISLIIAQRLSKISTPFIVDAIDIDKPSVEEANYNFSQSPWAEKLVAIENPLQDLIKKSEGKKYQLIVSNPPYFIDSLKAPCKRRTSARHNDDLPYEVIVEAAVALLDEGGILAVILPREEGDKFISLTAGKPLQLARLCRVHTLAGKKEKRYLMEFVQTSKSVQFIEEHLVMQQTGGLEYTGQYKDLTKDFYL